MNRIDRLTGIILMLQGRRVVTAEQVAERFGISVRTVYRDLAALGEVGVPITAEAGVGYTLMRGYHLPPVMFSEAEAAALFMAGELGERFGDASLQQAVRGAMLKIRAALPSERRDYLGRLGGSLSVQRSGPLPGAAGEPAELALMGLQEAVVRRRCLRFRYNTGGLGERTDRVVEPLGLVFYADRWHLIAWCRLRRATRDFRLDRIGDLQALDETFHGHDDFSLIDYLRHEVPEDQLIPVAVEVESRVLDRLTADLPAQIVETRNLPDGRFRVDALAYSLDWLVGWLLALGTAARVLAPPALQQKLAAAAREVADLYPAAPEPEISPATDHS